MAASFRSRPRPLRSGTRVGVAGVGLIGGSIALRATARGAVVRGWQPDADALGDAVARGIVHAATPSFEALTLASDVLILAAPLEGVLVCLERLRAMSRRSPLVFEVSSVMRAPAEAAAGLDGFVATHPMAGSERSGHAAAREDLFEGCTWAYDPTAAESATRAAREFIAAMGGRPFGIEPTAHDRAVALTSHAPQLLSVALGVALAGRLDEPGVAALRGPGVHSMLRLARSSWPMWKSVLAANAVPVAQEVRGLAAILLDAAGALERGEAAMLERAFVAAARAAADTLLPKENREEVDG